jgi:hypothetical protein
MQYLGTYIRNEKKRNDNINSKNQITTLKFIYDGHLKIIKTRDPSLFKKIKSVR